MVTLQEAQEAKIVPWSAAAADGNLPLRATGVAKSFGGGFDLSQAPCPGVATASARARRRVVDDVSFEIRRGEIFGVIGANGSGKSTLIRMISTLLLPDGGDVQHLRVRCRARVDGGAGADQPRVGRPVVLPQHDARWRT